MKYITQNTKIQSEVEILNEENRPLLRNGKVDIFQ